MWQALLFSGLLALVAADQKFAGQCPPVTPVANFDLERFSKGSWHLIEQSDDDRDTCVAYSFVSTPQQLRIKSGLDKYGRPYQKPKPFVLDSPGIFSVIDYDGDRNVYLVADTDYENYAALFRCKQKWNVHEQEVYILLRQGKLAVPDPLVSEIKTRLASKGVLVTFYMRVPHVNCPPVVTNPTPTGPYTYTPNYPYQHNPYVTPNNP